MVWRVGARVHAFVHGLFKPGEAELVRQQWGEIEYLFQQVGVAESTGRAHLIAVLAENVRERLGVPGEHEQAELIHVLIADLFEFEGLFQLPEIDWSQAHTIAELWDIREELSRQRGFVSDFEDNCGLLEIGIAAMVEPIYAACPALLDDGSDADGITVPTSLLESIGNLGTVTQTMLGAAFTEELDERGLLARLGNRLERNLIAASGGNPADPRGFSRAPKMTA